MLKIVMMYLNVVILKFKMIVSKLYGVEIKNKRNKNILCGCIYRHPKYDLSEFMIYLETSLKKVVNENKEVYICADFNIDLLKVEEKKQLPALL